MFNLMDSCTLSKCFIGVRSYIIMCKYFDVEWFDFRQKSIERDGDTGIPLLMSLPHACSVLFESNR